MRKCFLGLDIGTTGIKAVIFDNAGRPLGQGLSEYSLETPSPDFVELPPEQYWQSTRSAVKEAMHVSQCAVSDIAALGITGQAETLIMVDAHGTPVRKAIVWLDNRASEEAGILRRELGDERLFKLSGQTEMLPCWPAAKILWYRRHEPDLFAHTDKFLMVEDYIAYRLTGDYGSCRGMLPSTSYYDITTGEYASDVLDCLGITASQLPPLKDAGEEFGLVSAAVVDEIPLNAGIPVVCAPIDHVCGNLGSGCNREGIVSETTGCSLAVCAAFPQAVYDEKRRISTYLGYEKGTYVLLPWAPTAGMVLKYFRDEFAGGADYQTLGREASAIPPGSDGLLLLPHLAGAISPVCNPNARGTAYGITLAHKRAHWTRAIMESISYLLRDNLETLHGLGADINEVRCLGGASKSLLWLQIKADVLNMPVVVTECPEATALGAAILAAIASGEYPNAASAIDAMVRVKERVLPSHHSGQYQSLFQKYREIDRMLLKTF